MIANLLKPSDEIEKTTAHFFDIEIILDKMCRKIQSMGFEFSAIQLIRPEEAIIETVYARGFASEWTGLAKHFLEKDWKLRDIQADIAQTHFTEIISGWDDRFDRWIYDKYGHENLARVFTPIVLVRDFEKGNVIDDWFKHFESKIAIKEENRLGEKTVIEILAQDKQIKEGWVKEAIGTVEAGYQDPKAVIEPETAVELAKLVAQESLEIRKALLPYILEQIVERARKIVQADSASLHFIGDCRLRTYCYEVCSGAIGPRFLRNHPPRPCKLGWQAIQAQEPKFIPKSSQNSNALKHYNPEIFAEGIKAIAAFPLVVDQNKGVLYIHYHREHQFSDDEINLVQLFVNRAVDAIRHATSYIQVRDRAIQLATLHSISQSIARIPEERELLHHIAWSALNALAADVVTIYEYIEDKKQFVIPPVLAGKLRIKQEMTEKIHEHDAPTLLVRDGFNIYAKNSFRNHILNNPNKCHEDSFVIREKIKSSAGILLKVSNNTVGVMFINYRRFYPFSDQEKKYIDTFAASAAIAIKNRQLLENLADNEIITTPKKEWIFSRILEQAMRPVFSIQSEGNQKLLIQAHTMTIVSELVGLLVHSINNDVGAIQQLAKSILEASDSDENIGHVTNIKSMSDQVLQVTKTLMQRIPDDSQLCDLCQIPISLQQVDIYQIVTKALSQVNKAASNITLNANNLPDNLLKVSGNEDKFFSIFINLVQNAIKAMPEGGLLSIGGKNIELEEKSWLEVWVQDNGIGVIAEDIEKIVKHSVMKGTQGTGRGLLLSRNYIESLGGQLIVSKLNHGSRFTVRLPALKQNNYSNSRKKANDVRQ